MVFIHENAIKLRNLKKTKVAVYTCCYISSSIISCSVRSYRLSDFNPRSSSRLLRPRFASILNEVVQIVRCHLVLVLDSTVLDSSAASTACRWTEKSPLFSACAGLQLCCQVILFCFGARFFCRQCTLVSHICFQGFAEKVTCLATVKTNMNGEIEQPVKVLPTRSKLQYMRTGSFSGLVQAIITEWYKGNPKRP